MMVKNRSDEILAYLQEIKELKEELKKKKNIILELQRSINDIQIHLGHYG